MLWERPQSSVSDAAREQYHRPRRCCCWYHRACQSCQHSGSRAVIVPALRASGGGDAGLQTFERLEAETGEMSCIVDEMRVLEKSMG